MKRMNVVLDQQIVDNIRKNLGHRSFSSLVRELLLKYLREKRKVKEL